MQQAEKEQKQGSHELSDDVVLGALGSLFRMLAFEEALHAHRKSHESFDRLIAGPELSVIAGAVAALRREDGVFPSDVDRAAALARGASMQEVAARTVAWKFLKVSPTGWHNGAHLVHAAGYAWAAKMKHDDAIALALGPEDVLETGEVHNALNFAGVFALPAIFLVRIREAALGNLRARALEYGIHVSSCDGGDAIAVCKAVRDARARAASGGGATLLGAVMRTGEHALRDSVDALRKHVVAQKAATIEQIEAMREAAVYEAKSAFQGEI
ncbi:MAG: thiamine pyrophosphate-dependent enzyme [Polyangiaceae bacterium]